MSMSIEYIIDRLNGFTPNGEMSHDDEMQMRVAAADLIQKNWTNAEIVDHLRWTEHVNPDVDEETALRRLRQTREAVSVRLSQSR